MSDNEGNFKLFTFTYLKQFDLEQFLEKLFKGNFFTMKVLRMNVI